MRIYIKSKDMISKIFYPLRPQLFRCELFHLIPGGFLFVLAAQMVTVGNCAVFPESLISTLVPCGYSMYLMKHSVLFQLTKIMHEMFTMREKTNSKFERYEMSIIFYALNFQ